MANYVKIALHAQTRRWLFTMFDQTSNCSVFILSIISSFLPVLMEMRIPIDQLCILLVNGLEEMN